MPELSAQQRIEFVNLIRHANIEVRQGYAPHNQIFLWLVGDPRNRLTLSVSAESSSCLIADGPMDECHFLVENPQLEAFRREVIDVSGR